MKAAGKTSLENRLNRLEELLVLAQSRIESLKKRAIKRGKEGHIKEIPVHLQAKKTIHVVLKEGRTDQRR